MGYATAAADAAVMTDRGRNSRVGYAYIMTVRYNGFLVHEG